MSKILAGKKTYIGLIVTLVGVFGLTKFISPAEAETLMKSIFEIVGIVIAMYGRFVAKK